MLPGSGAGRRAEAGEGADVGKGEPGLEARRSGEVPGITPALAEAPWEFGSPQSQKGGASLQRTWGLCSEAAVFVGGPPRQGSHLTLL